MNIISIRDIKWIDRAILFALLLLLDIVSKKFAIARMESNNVIFSSAFLTIIENFTLNEGISFGLFASFSQYIKYIMIVILGYLFWLTIKYKLKWSLLVFTGGLGNLIDRFIYDNCVIDFIEIRLMDYSLFVCNIADIYINIGVLLYFLHKYVFKCCFFE